MAVLQDLGKVSVIAKGAWSSSTAYEPLDIVSSNGGAYLSKKAVPAGTALSDTTYWQQITSRGEQGIQGEQGEQGETGNGIASVAKTSTSGNVDTYTITMTDGSTSTFTVTNGSVTSVDGMTGDIVLDNKANIDGSYDGMTVGSAQQLLASSGVEDKAPYAYRKSGGSMDIGDRAEVNEIDGLSLVVNQLVDTNTSSVTITSGNKYYAKIGGTASIAQSNGSAVAVTGGTDYVVDLTQLFGFATIADYVYSLEQSQSGAGVAWLRSHNIPLDIPYTAPTLMSVKTSGHKTVGFNQWDEDWELGTLNSTGQPASSSTSIRSKNYCNAVGGEAYYLKCGNYTSRYYLAIVFYDESKNFISQTFMSGETVTAPINARYFKIKTNNSTYIYGDTYLNDICINLSNSSRNGEYEPYVEHTYPLDSSLELRGIPKLDSNNKLYADGDIYAPSGDVTRRYGIVDLGSLTWVMSTVTEHNRFQANNLHALVKFATDNIICAKYLLSSTHSASFVADKVIVTSGSTQDNGRLWIWDDDYTSAADFKTAMSGVYLVYELATPTTETADPYQQVQIVDSDGTEEWIDERPISFPVAHKTTYLPDLGGKLESLPYPAESDGYYIIHQVNGKMTLVHHGDIPAAPTTEGTYHLSVTVSSGGTATYSWEAENG